MHIDNLNGWGEKFGGLTGPPSEYVRGWDLGGSKEVGYRDSPRILKGTEIILKTLIPFFFINFD